jgi:hypothetical protein
MNKHILSVGLVIFLLTALVIIYLEASSIDLPCMQAENWCEVDCLGDFSYGDCWDYGGHRYCYFYCSFEGFCYHWSGSPVYALCTFS